MPTKVKCNVCPYTVEGRDEKHANWKLQIHVRRKHSQSKPKRKYEKRVNFTPVNFCPNCGCDLKKIMFALSISH